MKISKHCHDVCHAISRLDPPNSTTSQVSVFPGKARERFRRPEF
jgi:hypothetical protein